MEEVKDRLLYVVARSVTMTDTPYEDRKELKKIPFGTTLTKLNRACEVINGKIKVSLMVREGHGMKASKRYITGWVPLIGVTADKIEDYAKLLYYNCMDKPIPTMSMYKGKKQIGRIMPGECVEVIAKVGHWGLTEKGWTIGKWLRRYRDIFDDKAAHTVMLGVLAWAATDYKKFVRMIRDKRYIVVGNVKKTRANFMGIMSEIDVIKDWFENGNYAIFFDTASGNDRLNDFDNELGVNADWWKEQERIRKEIKSGRRVKPWIMH